MNKLNNKNLNNLENIGDLPMPAHLHARIMKRVFFAGYGKYLAFSAIILAMNVGVLGMDLYRAFTADKASLALKGLRDGFAMTPSYFAAAARSIYDIVPVQSMVATALAIALSTYIAILFVRIYRNPQGIRLLRDNYKQ